MSEVAWVIMWRNLGLRLVVAHHALHGIQDRDDQIVLIGVRR